MRRLENVLRQFPKGIRIVELANKVGISRSYAYDLLNSLQLQGKAYYENGIAYPGKSRKPSKNNKFGFWEWLKWRREYEDERLDRQIRELEAECEKLEKEIFEEEE